MNIAIARLHALAHQIEMMTDIQSRMLAEQLRKWGDENVAEIRVSRVINYRDLEAVPESHLSSFWNHHLKLMAHQMSQVLTPLLETEEQDSFHGKIYQCRAFIVSINAKKIAAEFAGKMK